MAKNLINGGEVYLYGPVGISWMDGFTPVDVAQALAEHGDGDVTIRINSGGGNAFDGTAIYALLKKHPGKVTAYVDGVAASAASLILMAASERILSRGAGIMIHDPSTITIGNAAEHKKKTSFLEKLSNEYASLYALTSGQDEKQVRTMMKDETWLFGDEAVAKGFASKLSESKDEPKATAFAYDLYRHAPDHLPRCELQEFQPAASAASLEKTMPKPIPADESTPAVTDPNAAAATAQPAAGEPVAKAWAGSFYASAGASNLPIAELNAIVAESASLDQAKDKLIDKMAAAANADKPAADGARAQVGAESTEKFVEGATRSIIAKLPMFSSADGKPSADGEHNQFSQYSLRELARMSLELRGIKVRTPDTMEMVGMAFTPIMAGGSLSSSDFVNVLANVANKSMLKGYEEAEETFHLWTAKGSLSDFKEVTRIDTGLFPALSKVEEGAEYSFAKITDRKATLALATYGKMFGITRQAIINDDLGAFSRVPAKMGRAAKRTIGNLVYALLTSNVVMPDAVALFHANHNNLLTGGGSALATTSLDNARSTMAKQKDPDSVATALNIRPRHLLVPVALEGLATQLMNSQTDISQANPNVANKVRGMAGVVSEARLDAASTTAWYLAADQSQHDTFEVSYLNGIEAPKLERREGWNIDQVEWKIRIDAGVTALEHRTMLKANGA